MLRVVRYKNLNKNYQRRGVQTPPTAQQVRNFMSREKRRLSQLAAEGLQVFFLLKINL
jgi:hypothetical protein